MALLEAFRVRPADEPVWDSLRAAYLGMQQAMQDVIVSAVRERASRRGAPFGKGDPTPRAVTAAAFGCLVAAQRAWLEQDESGTFAAALDRAMGAVEPMTP